jgi:hypothetical protein
MGMSTGPRADDLPGGSLNRTEQMSHIKGSARRMPQRTAAQVRRRPLMIHLPLHPGRHRMASGTNIRNKRITRLPLRVIQSARCCSQMDEWHARHHLRGRRAHQDVRWLAGQAPVPPGRPVRARAGKPRGRRTAPHPSRAAPPLAGGGRASGRGPAGPPGPGREVERPRIPAFILVRSKDFADNR